MAEIDGSPFFFFSNSFVGTPIAIIAHFNYFLYMYRVWGVAPGDLFLAFDKWGVDGVKKASFSFLFFLLFFFVHF